MRGPLAWPPVPVMSTRRERFDEWVLDAVGVFEQRWGSSLTELEVAVQDVPPTDPHPWEESVALGRLFPAQGSTHARIVIYRRPIEARSHRPADVAAVVHEVVIEQLARMVGVDPDDFL